MPIHLQIESDCLRSIRRQVPNLPHPAPMQNHQVGVMHQHRNLRNKSSTLNLVILMIAIGLFQWVILRDLRAPLLMVLFYFNQRMSIVLSISYIIANSVQEFVCHSTLQYNKDGSITCLYTHWLFALVFMLSSGVGELVYSRALRYTRNRNVEYIYIYGLLASILILSPLIR